MTTNDASPRKNDSRLLKPGVYTDLPADDYFALPYASSTSLRRLLRLSPAHARVEIEETDALRIGTAAHAATLEPEGAARLYYRVGIPKPDGRTKEGKLLREDAEKSAKGRIILWEEEAQAIDAMRSAIWNHPIAADLLRHSDRELTIIWDDVTGVRCKARIDALSRMDEGLLILADVKTTSGGAHVDFQRSLANYDYHIQAAFYLRAAEAAGLHCERFVFIVVEKQPPFGVVTHLLDDEAIAKGWEAIMRGLARWGECEATGQWPSYPKDLVPLTLPKWHSKEEKEPWLVN